MRHSVKLGEIFITCLTWVIRLWNTVTCCWNWQGKQCSSEHFSVLNLLLRSMTLQCWSEASVLPCFQGKNSALLLLPDLSTVTHLFCVLSLMIGVQYSYWQYFESLGPLTIESTWNWLVGDGMEPPRLMQCVVAKLWVVLFRKIWVTGLSELGVPEKRVQLQMVHHSNNFKSLLWSVLRASVKSSGWANVF